MKFKVKLEAKEISEKGLRKYFETKKELQSSAGLSHPTISPFFKGSGEVTFNTVSKFAEAIKVEIADLVYFPNSLLDSAEISSSKKTDRKFREDFENKGDWDILIDAGVSILRRMEEKKGNMRIETITVQELSFETGKRFSPAEIRYILSFADIDKKEAMNRLFWRIVERALENVNKALKLSQFRELFEDEKDGYFCSTEDKEIWAQKLKYFLYERLSDYEKVFEEYSFLLSLMYYLIEVEPMVYRDKITSNQDPLLKELSSFYSNYLSYLFPDGNWGDDLKKEALISALLLGPIISTRVYQDAEITARIHDMKLLITLVFDGIAPVTKQRIKRLCRHMSDDELSHTILHLNSGIQSVRKKRELIRALQHSLKNIEVLTEQEMFEAVTFSVEDGKNKDDPRQKEIEAGRKMNDLYEEDNGNHLKNMDKFNKERENKDSCAIT